MAVVMALQNLRADGDIAESGGISKMNVTDSDQVGLLTGILKELKKMNLHMAIMNDVVIENTEVM